MAQRKTLFFLTAALLAFNGSYDRLAAQSEPAITLPLVEKSVRFAIIGDNGNASRPQYEVADQMDRLRQKVNFDFVLMLGDNLYGGKSPSDYKSKFETPYKLLLDGGVKFYAPLGNHDDP